MLTDMRIIVLVALAALLISGESWSIPRTWAGKKAGSQENNPLVDNAGPRWRADQIYPDKPEDLANWKPMGCAESQRNLVWFNEPGSQGGNPHIRVEKSRLIMGVYSLATNMEWAKVPAVVFIAPRDGGYKLVQETAYKGWEGNGVVMVRYFRIDRVAKTVEAVGSDIAGSPDARRGESRVVRLAKGDELAVSFWIDGHHAGATVTASVAVSTAKLPE